MPPALDLVETVKQRSFARLANTLSAAFGIDAGLFDDGHSL
jgi:hypothetical protein